MRVLPHGQAAHQGIPAMPAHRLTALPSSPDAMPNADSLASAPTATKTWPVYSALVRSSARRQTGARGPHAAVSRDRSGERFAAIVAWYRDVLGLSIGWYEPNEFCTFTSEMGGASLALATDHPDRISDRPGTGWMPTFSVDTFDATIARLREGGVAFDAEEAEEGSDSSGFGIRRETRSASLPTDPSG